jgi:hypothetical protein
VQILVITIFSKDIHRPSGAKEWQIPPKFVVPIPLLYLFDEPLDEHDTSYLALSVKILNLFASIINSPKQTFVYIIKQYFIKVKHLFIFLKII